MSLSFGTDGVRGVANSELTPEFVLALGRAIARTLCADLQGTPFLIARDTRISGPMLQQALTAGLTSEGVDVADVGVIPTGGLARLGAMQDAPAAMISASHNPFADNGIKVFAPGGLKLADSVEQRLEQELQLVLGGTNEPSRTGLEVGRAARLAKGHTWYGEQLVEQLGGRTLDGINVVLDLANGAATSMALDAFGDAGADVEVINDRPNGSNINEHCGSTFPAGLQKAVIEQEARVGLAFDGDADRVLAVDETGSLIDGDHLLAMLAIDRKESGTLASGTVVTTVMANLGFHHSMEMHGIKVIETNVGDRYVLEALEAGGYTLGGEQSGHIILRDLATTGDGLLTGMMVLDLMVRSRKSLSQLAHEAMTRLPQVLRSVRVADRSALDGSDTVHIAVRDAQERLGDAGRILLRSSGTEPVVRVMVEAPSEPIALDIAEQLCAVIEHSLA